MCAPGRGGLGCKLYSAQNGAHGVWDARVKHVRADADSRATSVVCLTVCLYAFMRSSGVFYELCMYQYLLFEISAPIEKYRTEDETAENADYNKTLKHAAGCSRHVSNMTIIGDPTRDPPALPCMHRPCLAVRHAYKSRAHALVPPPKPTQEACSTY